MSITWQDRLIFGRRVFLASFAVLLLTMVVIKVGAGKTIHDFMVMLAVMSAVSMSMHLPVWMFGLHFARSEGSDNNQSEQHDLRNTMMTWLIALFITSCALGLCSLVSHIPSRDMQPILSKGFSLVITGVSAVVLFGIWFHEDVLWRWREKIARRRAQLQGQ